MRYTEIIHIKYKTTCNLSCTTAWPQEYIMWLWKTCYTGTAFIYETLKRNCCHFDHIFITGCTEGCHFDNVQWCKCRQNDDISVSVNAFCKRGREEFSVQRRCRDIRVRASISYVGGSLWINHMRKHLHMKIFLYPRSMMHDGKLPNKYTLWKHNGGYRGKWAKVWSCVDKLTRPWIYPIILAHYQVFQLPQLLVLGPGCISLRTHLWTWEKMYA